MDKVYIYPACDEHEVDVVTIRNKLLLGYKVETFQEHLPVILNHLQAELDGILLEVYFSETSTWIRRRVIR